MEFHLFDRDAIADATASEGRALVRVGRTGRLLFNRPASDFLREQYGAGLQLEVALMFSAENRTVGVRPLAEREVKEMPVGARWPVVVHRSVDWVVGVAAPEFVEHYQIAEGEYPATLVRGPGPRMLTFQARKASRSPTRRNALVQATNGG